jgi:curli biogenesis system outer membrane secretion channel CsgG
MFRVGTCLGVALLFVGLVCCGSSSKTTAEPDKLTEDVGVYSDPPVGLIPKTAGVPPFLDARPKEKAQADVDNLGALAADQLATLLVRAQRFQVIERSQLDQLLKEQELEGIVDPNELAQPGKVRGVKYLVIGKITNYRVATEKSGGGFGLAKIGEFVGAVDVDTKKTEIKVECGVDLRVVDSTTGVIVAADFGEYKRTDTLSAFGVEVLGAKANSEGEIQLDADNQGKILRLALDQALRRMLKRLDTGLLQQQRIAAEAR